MGSPNLVITLVIELSSPCIRHRLHDYAAFGATFRRVVQFPYFLSALFQYTDPAPHQRFQDKNQGTNAKEVKTKTPARSAGAPEAHGSKYFKGMAPGQKRRDDVKKTSESETWVYELQWGTTEK